MKLAAKGLAERARRPMPVMTDKAFYEVMAAAALDAMDLPALLERVTRAERELEIVQVALTRADTEAKRGPSSADDRWSGFRGIFVCFNFERGEHEPRTNRHPQPAPKSLAKRPGAP